MALTTTEEALVRQLLEQQAAILSLAGSESTIISKLGANKVTIADLPNAATIADADLFLLRQGTQEKNVTGAVVKALASAAVAGATDTVAGIVELATNAEAQTGTDNSRAVTPAAMASVTATETRAGLLEIATDAEARAFTANKAIDGAKLASALTGSNQSLATNGYQKLPGGLIIQWGESASLSTDTNSTLTFPIAFPTGCVKAFVSIRNTTTGDDDVFSRILSYTSTQITVRAEKTSGGSNAGTRYVEYFAIGY